LWWSPPVSGNPDLRRERLIGYSSVAVPPHGSTAITPPMTGHIPSSAGPHICLFAQVSHELDMPDIYPSDPDWILLDRHWAQRNLMVAPVNSDPIRILVNNSLRDLARFRLRIQSVNDATWPQLAEAVRAELVRRTAEFRLLDIGTGEETVGEDTIDHWIELSPGESRAVELVIGVGDIEDGTAAAYELLQYLEEAAVGGLGVALRAPE
jgi:hypothetical protein